MNRFLPRSTVSLSTNRLMTYLRKTILVTSSIGLILISAAVVNAGGKQLPSPQNGPTEPDRTVVLSGTVVTPARILKKAWIVIKQGRLAQISETAVSEPNAILVNTDDLIFPGFIDLHNHPIFAAFSRWQDHPKFNNRYEWRSSPAYAEVVERPARAIEHNEQGFCDLEEFAEVKAIIGGTTSLAGIMPRRPPNAAAPDCVSGLARKLGLKSGLYADGRERIQNVIGLTPRDMSEATAQEVKARLADGSLDLFLVHVAEGKASDSESASEFSLLKAGGFLGPRTAIIHGVALKKDDFREMHAAGTALIWSPRSNMELYGETADVATAFREGVSIAVAPDWAPTGSDDMLDELKYAASVSETSLNGLFSNRQLFEMSTSIAARVAGIDEKVGSLQVGLYADLFLLHRNTGYSTDRAFDRVIRSHPQNIDLVMVAGVPVYGSKELIDKFHVPSEQLTVCGSRKALNRDLLGSGSFSEVETRIKKEMSAYKVQPGEIADCK